MTTERATLDTSGEALRRLQGRAQAEQAQRVLEAVRVCLLRGRPDASLSEIQAAYEARFERRIDKSGVSARVNELVAAGRLVRLEERRLCSISHASVRPVTMPMRQERLV